MSFFALCIVALCVALGTLIPLAIIIGGIMIVMRLLGGGGSGIDPSQQAEETQMIQDMHRSLARMEERVEAMETILFDAPAVARKADRDTTE
jgi:phage shock protein B